MHTYIDTYMHTYIHAYIHRRAHIQSSGVSSRPNTLQNDHQGRQVLVCRCLYSYIHAYLYAYLHTYMCSYIHVLTREGYGYLLKEIIDSDLLNMLTPLMESMNHFGIRGPTGMFHVYYYSRNLEGERKLKPMSESVGCRNGDVGVIETACPEQLIDKFGIHLCIVH